MATGGGGAGASTGGGGGGGGGGGRLSFPPPHAAANGSTIAAMTPTARRAKVLGGVRGADWVVRFMRGRARLSCIVVVMARSIVRPRAERKGYCASNMPHRERYLFICTNRRPAGHSKGSCAEKGSEELVLKLKAAIAERGGKEVVRACATACLDLCETGASIVQEPDHVAYGNVTLADLPELADAVLAGRVLQRLVVHPVFVNPVGHSPPKE